MTSAPVNGVGSLLNFVGNRAAQTVNMEAAGSFGDVMSKASGNQTQSGGFEKCNTVSEAGRSKLNTPHTSKEISKADAKAQNVKAKDVEGNSDEAIQKAGKELVKEVAQKLGVTEEEVVNAMEELGFGMAALLDADNLTQLVLTISGEDSLALLTNGELYGTVQDLIQCLEEMTVQLANELGISAEDVTKLVEDSIAANQSDNTEQTEVNPILQNQEEAGEETQAKVTVTVESGDETITLSTDEKGNVKQVENVVQKETTEQDMGENAKQQPGQRSETESKGQMMESANPILENVLQNKMQMTEVNFEQTQFYMTPDTNEIMNQILDYMKIQLKPGMDQLTMQLHPESLGTLHVQITSRGGEVTAQFQVQNEAVKAAIESQIVELKDSLREQGIKVEAVEVTVESHAFESNLWQGQERDENASYQSSRKTPRRINLNELGEGLEGLDGEEEKLAAEMMEANGNTVDYTA